MSDGFIQVPADSVGKKVDVAELDVGGTTVERQRVVIASNTGSSTFATILSSSPALTDGGLVVRNIPSGTQVVSGQVSLGAGTANIGTINNISATINVVVASGLALNASTANIGTINNVSATVIVAGNIGLATGTNNIGIINDISATLDVFIAAGTNNIGGVSLVAGTSNIGFINHISQTVNVILAAGSNLIGSLNNISATVVTGLSYVTEKTSNSQVQVGDSANAAIRVNIVAGAAAGGTSIADRGAFTEATTQLTPAGGVFSDTRSAVAEDAVAALRITNQAGLHVNLRTDGGTKMDDSANNALRVNIVAGGGTGGTALSDRAAFSEAVTLLTPAGGVFSDTRSAIAEDSAAALRLNAQGGLHVNLRDSSGNEISAGNALSVKVERISATASVILAAGTANIGTINNISATVLIAGTVSLGAGTANIGSVNNISATVVVAGTVSLGAGTALIGAVSLAAGTSNIGFINNISATIAAVLAAGSANIGSINNISRTVVCGLAYALDLTAGSQVVVGDSANSALRVNIVADVFATAVTAVMSSSHGPVMVPCSVSAATTLIASPGAGVSLYITQIGVSNANTINPVLARIGTSASASAIVMIMAANGGGFVMNFDPPWKLSASERAICSVKPGNANAYFNINFYVAA